MFLFLLLFCYVFAFYIGPISVSLLIAFPCYIYGIFCKKYFACIEGVLRTSYIKNIFVGWSFIVFLGLLFPVLYGTYDFSFFRVVFVQLFHLIAAIPVLAILKYKDYSYCEIEKVFVYLFVVQTLIQCIVVSNATLSELILYFNRYEAPLKPELGSAIRGKALSAATTYHLSLIYGVGFLIYVKRFLSVRITFTNIILGLLIFVGIFFAGRTGFVGVGIGMLAFLFSTNVRWWKKIQLFLLLIIALTFVVILVSYWFPPFYILLEEQVIPYAFEFIYSLDKTGQVETASTNRLMEMWSNPDFNYMEFLIGSGKYVENGSYYMHVDPGILRHTLFMGIIGYIALLIYQLLLFPIWKMQGKTQYYYLLILIYWFIMEFKGVTLATNKFVFAVSILLSFSYLELNNIFVEREKYE